MQKVLYWKLGLMVLIACMAVALVIARPSTGNANPSYFCSVKQSATATTSAKYITFGVGTTTLKLDSVVDCGTITTKADSALLLFQFDATSTISSPLLNVRVEYSTDNIDWYPSTNEVTANATTTQLTGTYAEYQLAIATTTAATDQGGSGFVGQSVSSLASSTLMFSKSISTPTRYTRVIFTMPSNGGKGALWASLEPVKQNN